ncbi:hypothetical protein VM1G_04493 [Cytospora mali]|uniref:Arrestin-like N-terminal domain-containing protein n=1 Tax=Cytospora mali TaxID=578113 RepID=A0A194VWC3_CYTMA|nr:hypothetical protein VM1G_04493 [Valsa mali]
MESTSSSEASSLLSTHAKKMSFPKSNIQIHLENHFKAKVYTSSSPLSGEVTITTQRDVYFDNVEIILLGLSKTRTDGHSVPHETTHTFLKLIMPISESMYPVPRVLEAGTTLKVPFNFVLPKFLTLNACTHTVGSDHVRDHHLCPPPSMGLWGRGHWEKDDLSPQMAEIEYSIKARVWRLPELQGRAVKVMEAIKPIQFLPAFAEDAPLNITKMDRLYRMSKSKTIRKNLIAAKMGKLTVAGQQPRAIMMQPDGQGAASTTAQFDLKFEPMSADIQPPKITIVSSKIIAHTYYSSGPLDTLTSIGDFNTGIITHRRGVYSKSVNLHTDPVESGTWFTYQAGRDSGYCSDTAQENTTSEEEDCEEEKQQQQQRQRRMSRTIANLVRPSKQRSPPSPFYHTTTLQLPISLPIAKKYFVPTFHSCIASRVYTLHVSLSVTSGPTTSSNISLDLPIQVAVEAVMPNGNEEEGLPSFEDAVEDAAVDELFTPRLLSIPQAEFRGTSVLPGYVVR